MKAGFSLLVLFILTIGQVESASAMTSAPVHSAYLELRELAPGDFRVLWKRPSSAVGSTAIKPLLPEHCVRRSMPRLQPHVSTPVDHWVVHCGRKSIAGMWLGVTGLDTPSAEALMKISLSNGAEYRVVLRQSSSVYRVPERIDPITRSLKFIAMGAHEVVTSAGHMLFLACLMLLTATPRMLLFTLICFSAGYSAVLSLGVVNGVLLPPLLASALVALSLLYVASELCRFYQGRRGLGAHAPWLVALVFGAVHGFDFAAVVVAESIADGELLNAMVSFALGVQAGPALLLLPVIVIKQLIRLQTQQTQQWEVGVPAYGMGAFAALWVIESTVAF